MLRVAVLTGTSPVLYHYSEKATLWRVSSSSTSFFPWHEQVRATMSGQSLEGNAPGLPFAIQPPFKDRAGVLQYLGQKGSEDFLLSRRTVCSCTSFSEALFRFSEYKRMLHILLYRDCSSPSRWIRQITKAKKSRFNYAGTLYHNALTTKAYWVSTHGLTSI